MNPRNEIFFWVFDGGKGGRLLGIATRKVSRRPPTPTLSTSPWRVHNYWFMRNAWCVIVKIIKCAFPAHFLPHLSSSLDWRRKKSTKFHIEISSHARRICLSFCLHPVGPRGRHREEKPLFLKFILVKKKLSTLWCNITLHLDNEQCFFSEALLKRKR